MCVKFSNFLKNSQYVKIAFDYYREFILLGKNFISKINKLFYVLENWIVVFMLPVFF
jgi:hypothetical protein